MKEFVEIFRSHVNTTPEKPIFRNLSNSTLGSEVTYVELFRTSWNLSKDLNAAVQGERVLLLFDNSIDFIQSFLACQMAGKVAVPMFFPKNNRYFERLKHIVKDSDCAVALCAPKYREKITNGFAFAEMDTPVFSFNFDVKDYGDDFFPQHNDIAFLQYTSGSTGNPKGTVISQKNLLHNQRLIQEAFGCNEKSVILTWLPFYHDMGLIGNLLHAMYTGASCIIMSGAEVLQNPSRWLQAISTYNVTHSGGPNFIYDRCVRDIKPEQLFGVNLSSWQVAFNGSEPVRKETVVKFIDTFNSFGFDPKAYRTCYGLAEATLLVSEGSPDLSETVIPSGKVCGDLDLVFRTENGELSNEKGEICIHGKSVSEGYWKKDSSEHFILHNGKRYLRTGDAGQLHNGQLAVIGRLKEVIVVAGKNYYPYDLELEVAARISAIENNGVIVSYIHSGEKEEALVFAEIKRSELDSDLKAVVLEVNQVVLEIIGSKAGDVVLVGPRKLPRTSSGKLQRVQIKKQYLDNSLESLLEKDAKGVVKQKLKTLAMLVQASPHDDGELREYLEVLIASKLSIPEVVLKGDASLLDYGISSLNGVEIVHQINKDLSINMDVNILLELSNVSEIQDHITNLLWMKTQLSEGDEITI